MKCSSDPKSTRRSESGQIVLEYILLLVVGVAVAALITSRMVSRSQENPGFLIVKWMQIIQAIGQDTADDTGG